MTFPIALPPTDPPHDLAAAVHAAAAAPERQELWDEAERLAADHQRPEEVANAYGAVITSDALSHEVTLSLCERAVAFLGEWFEDGAAAAAVLQRAIAVDPSADWAFRRLTMQLTVACRWEELLGVYDRVVAATTAAGRRAELYGEAAQIARDLAGRADRAIEYLEALAELSPSDGQITQSLERLLEREGRWRELVELWRSRLPSLAPADAHQRRALIAGCLLDRLESPAEALDEALALANDGATRGSREAVAAALAIVERVFAFPGAPREIRGRALDELRRHYAASARPSDILRVLELALASAETRDKPALHREIAELLMGEARDAEALEHFAELLVLDPTDDAALLRLRELARRTARLDRYADALARAADAAAPARAVPLLTEAARVHVDEIADPEGATVLYRRVFDAPAVGDAAMLEVCRRLDGLLTAADAARVDVLERRAELEPLPEDKRRLRAETAALADARGDAERALRSWELVLAEDAADREAHEAVIAILEREAQWERLVTALLRSAEAPRARDAARDHRVRAARVHEEQLGAHDAAVAAWRDIETRFGQSEETIDALAALLSRAGHWQELATVLERGLELTLDPQRRQDLLQKLGDSYRVHSGQFLRALDCYLGVLAEHPAHAGALEGTRALLAEPSCRGQAAELLLAAFDQTGDWQGRLSLLEHRLEGAKDAAARTALLLEAADLHEERASDPALALADVARALPLSPDDTAIEARLLRLAEATGDWASAARALGLAVEALTLHLEGGAGERAAELDYRRGIVLETRLLDDAGALEAFLAGLALALGRTDLAAAAVRVATRSGRWDVASKALVDSSRARVAVDSALLDLFAAAASPRSWDAASSAVEHAVDAEIGLAPATAAELMRAVAVWHRDERGDLAAAEAVLARALARGGPRIETLQMLAGVQRRSPNRALVDTLLLLAGVEESALPSLYEAARVAVDVIRDAALSRTILERLLAEGSAALRRDEGAAAEGDAELATYAITGLVKLAEDDGDAERAVKILEEAATLPLGEAAARSRLMDAATIAEQRIGDLDHAVALYRRVLAAHPSDEGAVARLSAIFEARSSVPDLLSLRRHQLARATETSAKLALRLEIAELLGRAGDEAARIEVLRDNLADEAGHAASLEALAVLLEGGARHEELVTLLEAQASRLDERGDDHARAAGLWTRASALAESTLHDIDRALADRGRAVAGMPTAETYDALARLSTAKGDPAAAVGWLEKHLAVIDGSDHQDARIATLARLAQALVGAGRGDDARATLERGLAAHPGAELLRSPLRGLYRAAGAWDALVTLLSADPDGAGGPTSKDRVDELREAADVSLKKLQDRARAIPILKAMVARAPADRSARLVLAATLRATGNASSLDEARAILAGLLEEYGRRRPPERAEVHFQLAQVAAAANRTDEAKAQLETATSMSTEHAGALRMLAELYRDGGDLVRAERMFGALLLIALRQKPGAEDDPERPARSEVMINLYWILSALKQEGRANDMLASAFEAAKRSEHEASRLEAALRGAGDHALYLRALDARLARPDLSPREHGAVLSDMAELLGGPLDRPADAFAALLRAVELDPGSASLRDRATEMARRAGSIARWADALEALATKAEEDERPGLAAALFFALGELQEKDLASLPRALGHYQRAERLGADPRTAWRAIARAAAAVGDAGEEIRVLRLVAAGGETADQTEDAYRLAELELGSAAEISSGLSTLEWALGRAPDHVRASRMLRRAAEATSDPAVLLAYERVARASGDPATLLDALERSIAAGSGGMDLVREAVELASADASPDAAARAEALLQRAVALAEESRSGMGEAVWALVKLADRSDAAGDFATSLERLNRAIEAAEHEEAQRLTARAVDLAVRRLAKPELAAEAWERLLARDRHEREVWQPLLAIYRTLGDEAVLEAKLKDAIDCAFDVAWRGDLRVELARLIERARPDEAAAALDEVLRENDDNDAAATLLTTIYEREHRDEDLAGLLERRVSSARGRDDGAAVLALSLRLGALLEKARPAEAIDVYRAALEVSEERSVGPILERLFALFLGDDRVEDRADVLERMLKLASGREGADRALLLAELRERLGDKDGVARALDLGFRADPTATDLRERLAAMYAAEGQWAELGAMLEVEGAALPGAAGLARLREAASLFLERLDRPADAVRALSVAAQRAPNDTVILVDLSRALARAGDTKGMRERLGAALGRGDLSAKDRVALLRLRAELGPDDPTAALVDLEDAYRIDPRGVAVQLAAALESRGFGLDAGDPALLLRFVDLALDLGNVERARAALRGAIEGGFSDPVVVAKAAEIEGFDGRWEDAVSFARSLVELSAGPDRVRAALLLAAASERAGAPQDARVMLEQVFAEQPGQVELREHLRRIYEQTGAHRELAGLFLEEAQHATDSGERFACLRRAGSLLLESAGDGAAAIGPLEAARELKPRDHEVAVLLADAYIHAGKLQEAADFLDAAIQAQKGRRTREGSMMQQRMAKIARAVGDRGNELAWLNAAFESDAQNGDAAAALADVATELGQLDVAVKALKAITLMKSPKPLSRAMAYLRQAVIAQHQGDVRKASMLAKKAQSEDPSLVEAQTFLGELG